MDDLPGTPPCILYADMRMHECWPPQVVTQFPKVRRSTSREPTSRTRRTLKAMDSVCDALVP